MAGKTRKKRSTASTWKSKTGGKAAYAEDLELPSGNVALVRRVGPELFLSSGLLPDSLTAEVERAIKSKKGLPPSALQNMATDTKQLGDLMMMLDKVLVFACMEPPVQMPPACETGLPDGKVCGEYATHSRHLEHNHPEGHAFNPGERDDEVLYADVVDMEDKLFIMDFAIGGTRDFEKFREERESVMADISTGEDVEQASE